MTRWRWILVAAIAAALSPPAVRAEDTFRIGGAVERPAEWTAGRVLQELAPQVQTVRFTLRGEEQTARCVPLRLLIHPSPPQFENETKNHELGFAVFVTGRDGYTVCFSLGELAPEIGKRQVWLALEVDGKPLAGKDGPVRLLVPEDGKPARWTYGITRITLVDGRRSAPER
jgi:hypothetical protein